MTGIEEQVVKMLRQYLQDDRLKNVLTGKPENVDKELLFYINMAIDDYNITPPPLSPVLIDSFPSTSLLIQGAIVHILLSNGILQIRNQLSYSDGGGMLQLYEKGPQYFQGAQQFASQYERKKEEFKIAMNMAAGWGVVSPMADYNLLLFTCDDT